MTLTPEQALAELVAAIDAPYSEAGRGRFGLAISAARTALAAPADGWVRVPAELLEQTKAALQRHLDRHAPMRVPVDQTDSDIVLAKLAALPAPKG